GLRALLHGDAGRPGPPSPHPQRPALPLLSRRSALEVFLLHADGGTERVIVGPDLRSGHNVQLLIPGNTFHTARLIGQRRWFLGASTEWPGVVPADVALGNVDELAAKYPPGAARVQAIR